MKMIGREKSMIIAVVSIEAGREEGDPNITSIVALREVNVNTASRPRLVYVTLAITMNVVKKYNTTPITFNKRVIFAEFSKLFSIDIFTPKFDQIFLYTFFVMFVVLQ